MSDWAVGYVRCDSDPFPDDKPWNWIDVGLGTTYLLAERSRYDSDTPLPASILGDAAVIAAGGSQIGLWIGQDPHGPIDDAAYQEHVQPFGNSAETKLATSHLRAACFAGHEQVALGNPEAEGLEKLYPADKQPFDLEFRHWYFENPAAPAADGWGFVGEMHGDASLRDPSVRSVGAFTDDTYTGVLWPTTGGFIRGPSRWQVDEAGEPLEVWYIESWDGHRQEEKIDWNIAVLYSSIHEGRAFLPATSGGIRYLFWEQSQPPPPGTGQWVDTGQTVGYASGDVLRIQNTTGFSVGDLLRVDGTELTVKTVHSSIDLLCNEITTGLPAGAVVERYESVL